MIDTMAALQIVNKKKMRYPADSNSGLHSSGRIRYAHMLQATEPSKAAAPFFTHLARGSGFRRLMRMLDQPYEL